MKKLLIVVLLFFVFSSAFAQTETERNRVFVKGGFSYMGFRTPKLSESVNTTLDNRLLGLSLTLGGNYLFSKEAGLEYAGELTTVFNFPASGSSLINGKKPSYDSDFFGLTARTGVNKIFEFNEKIDFVAGAGIFCDALINHLRIIYSKANKYYSEQGNTSLSVGLDFNFESRFRLTDRIKASAGITADVSFYSLGSEYSYTHRGNYFEANKSLLKSSWTFAVNATLYGGIIFSF